MGVAAGNVHFTYAQLEGIWQQAGGNPQYAGMAAAIAMAESGGNSAAFGNNTNGSIDRGLWQINSTHGAQSTFDIMGNARAAVAISNNGTNWRPWCTAYSDGACGSRGGSYLGAGAPYQKYLQGNTPPDLNAPINGTNGAAGQPPPQLQACSTWETILAPGACAIAGAGGVAGALNPANIIGGIVGAIINPMIQIVAGVMGITGGILIMVGGGFLVIRKTETYQSTKSAAVQGAGTMAWLFGPEAGAAGEAATQGAEVTTTRRMQIGRFQQTQRTRQPSTAELLRAEAARYGRVQQ